MDKKLFEKLAHIEHKRWSKRQKYMMENLFNIIGEEGANYILKISKEQWGNWERQIKTNYKDLTENEKNSDREEVRKYWDLIK